jgi:hypothetical protein
MFLNIKYIKLWLLNIFIFEMYKNNILFIFKNIFNISVSKYFKNIKIK